MHNDDPQSRAVITMLPIGVIHTPFQQSEGTPIQSATANGAQGVIELYPEFAPGLLDVADFERLWLIYCWIAPLRPS
jgi:tRNA (Thr-GGU) A37 N-methylase